MMFQNHFFMAFTFLMFMACTFKNTCLAFRDGVEIRPKNLPYCWFWARWLTGRLYLERLAANSRQQTSWYRVIPSEGWGGGWRNSTETQQSSCLSDRLGWVSSYVCRFSLEVMRSVRGVRNCVGFAKLLCTWTDRFQVEFASNLTALRSVYTERDRGFAKKWSK